MSIEITLSADKDALLLAMCDKLPPLGEVFTSGDQERWLDAMRAILAFLYAPDWASEARRKAKEAAAAHFPTITVPEGGVTIAGPVSEPVLAVPKDDELDITPQSILNAALTIAKAKSLPPEEEPSTTSADAVDDESGGEATADSGAGPAPDTSFVRSATSPPGSAPTSPSSGDPVPAPVHDQKLGTGVRIEPTPRDPATPYARRHFTADQKGALLRRVVREGINAVAQDAMIHETTLRRWMREMPVSVQTFTEEWEAEQKAAAIAEGAPTVAELEAEKETPVPSRMTEDMQRRAAELAAKPPVQWPTSPFERRPVDHAAVLRSQADQA